MRSLRNVLFLSAAVAIAAASVAQATTIPVVEDVMTSAFFQGANLVRGYPGDARPVMRVSSDNAFGSGPETVYLTFDPAAFGSYGGPVPQALLSIESVAGGFGADASAMNPFVMSAHAVSADPIASITDDTNPSGPISWSSFFANNILPASVAARTTVTGFGRLQFDVTEIVNNWISGSNTVFAIALTGKHDTLSDGNVLHGLLNNNDTSVLGSTFITIVPEPTALALAVLGVAAAFVGRGRRQHACGG